MEITAYIKVNDHYDDIVITHQEIVDFVMEKTLQKYNLNTSEETFILKIDVDTKRK